MSSEGNLDAIAEEGERFLNFASRDPERTVPQYPPWVLRDLVIHVAAIHGRTIAVCETLPRERIRAPQLPDEVNPFDWGWENLSAMVNALDKADSEAEVWSFTSPHNLSTWERRMVIETGMHRWDAQQAFEDPDPLLALVAASGLDEFTDMWLPQLGEVPALELRATDLDRSWRFGDEEPVEAISGTASDLFLRLMARPGVEIPESWAVAVDGLSSPVR